MDEQYIIVIVTFITVHGVNHSMDDKDTLVILGFPDFDKEEMKEWIYNLPEDIYLPENIQFMAVNSDVSALKISKEEIAEYIEEENE